MSSTPENVYCTSGWGFSRWICFWRSHSFFIEHCLDAFRLRQRHGLFPFTSGLPRVKWKNNSQWVTKVHFDSPQVTIGKAMCDKWGIRMGLEWWVWRLYQPCVFMRLFFNFLILNASLNLSIGQEVYRNNKAPLESVSPCCDIQTWPLLSKSPKCKRNFLNVI